MATKLTHRVRRDRPEPHPCVDTVAGRQFEFEHKTHSPMTRALLSREWKAYSTHNGRPLIAKMPRTKRTKTDTHTGRGGSRGY